MVGEKVTHRRVVLFEPSLMPIQAVAGEIQVEEQRSLSRQ